MPGHQGSKVFGQWEMAKQHRWGLNRGSAEANPSPPALPAKVLGCLVERWVSPGSLNPSYLCVCYPINNSFIFSGVYQVSFLLSPDLKMYDVSRKKGSDACYGSDRFNQASLILSELEECLSLATCKRYWKTIALWYYERCRKVRWRYRSPSLSPWPASTWILFTFCLFLFSSQCSFHR